MTVYVYGYKDVKPEDKVINTTSRSTTWSRGLSPFFLGECPLYGSYVAKNVENAWQFCKVYSQHLRGNEVTKDYWNWARRGWSDNWAHRYPMGRGAKPEFSLWDGQRLGYIEARQRIYIPVYAQAVVKSEAYCVLKEKYEREGSNPSFGTNQNINNKGLSWLRLIGHIKLHVN